MEKSRTPRIEIHYCTQCRFILRANWIAQELLMTFGDKISELALIPTSGGDCTIRIARGGSFTSPQQSIRNTKREQFKAGEKLSRIGIRIARELP